MDLVLLGNGTFDHDRGEWLPLHIRKIHEDVRVLQRSLGVSFIFGVQSQSSGYLRGRLAFVGRLNIETSSTTAGLHYK